MRWIPVVATLAVGVLAVVVCGLLYVREIQRRHRGMLLQCVRIGFLFVLAGLAREFHDNLVLASMSLSLLGLYVQARHYSRRLAQVEL